MLNVIVFVLCASAERSPILDHRLEIDVQSQRELVERDIVVLATEDVAATENAIRGLAPRLGERRTVWLLRGGQRIDADDPRIAELVPGDRLELIRQTRVESNSLGVVKPINLGRGETRVRRVTVTSPLGVEVHHKVLGLPQPIVSVEGTVRRLELMVPSNHVPTEPSGLFLSTVPSWKGVAATYDAVNNELPAGRLPSFASQLATRDEKIKWALGFAAAQQTDPISPPLPRTQPELSRARLAAAVLRALGLPARVAVTDSIGLWPDLPSDATLFECAVYVEGVSGDEPVWLEVGRHPGPLVSTSLLAKGFLVLDPANPRIENSEPGSAGRSTLELVTTFDLRATGAAANLDEVETRTGELFDTSAERTGEQMTRALIEQLQTTRVEIVGAPTVGLSFLRRRHRAAVQSGRLLALGGMVPISGRIARTAAQNASRLRDDHRPPLSPMRLSSTVQVKLPAGLVAAPWLPSRRDSAGCRWQQSISRSGDELTISRSIEFPKAYLEPDELQPAREAYDEWSRLPLDLPIHDEVPELTRAGRYVDAFELAKKRTAAHQVEVLTAARLPHVAIELGRSSVDKGSREARLAVDLSLLTALSTDEMGQHSPHVNAEERVAVARRIVKADPLNSHAVPELFRLLTRTRATKKDLAEAEALVRSTRAAGSPMLDEGWVRWLLANGKYEQVVADPGTRNLFPLVEAARIALKRSTTREPAILRELADARAYPALQWLEEQDPSEPLSQELKAWTQRHEAQPFDPASASEVAIELLAHRWGATTRAPAKQVFGATDWSPLSVERADRLIDTLRRTRRTNAVTDREVIVSLGYDQPIAAVVLQKSGSSKWVAHPDLHPTRVSARLLREVTKGTDDELRGWLLAASMVAGLTSKPLDKWERVDLEASALATIVEDRLELPLPGRADVEAALGFAGEAWFPAKTPKEHLRNEQLLDLALAVGLPQAALDLIRRERWPTAEGRFAYEATALLDLKRLPEAEKLASAQLEASPDSVGARQIMMAAAFLAGDHSRRRELARLAIAAFKNDRQRRMIQNASAWDALFDAVDEQALVDAREAAAGPAGDDPAVLGTLTAVLAAGGRTDEAIAALNRYWATRPVRSQQQEIVFAQGCIAEALGLPDEAARLWSSITRLRKQSIVNDLHPVVKRRLEQLQRRRR